VIVSMGGDGRRWEKEKRGEGKERKESPKASLS
jgi:hypothetical protein